MASFPSLLCTVHYKYYLPLPTSVLVKTWCIQIPETNFGVYNFGVFPCRFWKLCVSVWKILSSNLFRRGLNLYNPPPINMPKMASLGFSATRSSLLVTVKEMTKCSNMGLKHICLDWITNTFYVLLLSIHVGISDVLYYQRCNACYMGLIWGREFFLGYIKWMDQLEYTVMIILHRQCLSILGNIPWKGGI